MQQAAAATRRFKLTRSTDDTDGDGSISVFGLHDKEYGHAYRFTLFVKLATMHLECSFSPYSVQRAFEWQQGDDTSLPTAKWLGVKGNISAAPHTFECTLKQTSDGAGHLVVSEKREDPKAHPELPLVCLDIDIPYEHWSQVAPIVACAVPPPSATTLIARVVRREWSTEANNWRFVVA